MIFSVCFHIRVDNEQNTVHVFQIDAEIQNAFRYAFLVQAGRLLPKTGRLLARIGRFSQSCEMVLPKSAGFVRIPKFLKNRAASLVELPECV